MKCRKLVSLIFVGCVVSLSAVASAPLKLAVPEVETLPNGMQIIWFISDSLPVVDMMLVVKSGSRDDLPGKSGTAQLLESVLDRGAGGLNAEQLSHAVESLGASRYVSSDEDTFTIGMHGLAPDAPTLLDVLAKIALKPDFPASEVGREHARILDRWTHIGDSGDQLAGMAFHRLIATGTSYERGDLVSALEFDHVKRDDLLAFHNLHFTPKNAVFMVVGRVKKSEFREKILASFSAWQGDAPTKNHSVYVEERIHAKSGQIVVVDRPGLTQAQVRLGFKAPLIQAPEHYPLSVANALLGEYFNSRLNSVIRDKLGLTYGINSSFGYAKELAWFTISSATRNESVGQMIRKTTDILQELKTGGARVEEVQMAKDYMIGGFPLSVQTLGAVASRWLTGYLFDRGPNYMNEYEPKVSAVNREDVAAAVAKDFDLEHMVIVVAGDAKAIEKDLTKAQQKLVRRISAAELR